MQKHFENFVYVCYLDCYPSGVYMKTVHYQSKQNSFHETETMFCNSFPFHQRKRKKKKGPKEILIMNFVSPPKQQIQFKSFVMMMDRNFNFFSSPNTILRLIQTYFNTHNIFLYCCTIQQLLKWSDRYLAFRNSDFHKPLNYSTSHFILPSLVNFLPFFMIIFILFNVPLFRKANN